MPQNLSGGIGMGVNGKRILIVDDEPDLVGVLVAMLESSFALELINHQRFDLIISDIRMPGLDGYQLISAIKKSQINRSTPLAVLTAYVNESEKRALRLGAVKVFYKPLRGEELVNWMKKRCRIASIDPNKFHQALISGVKNVLEFYLQDSLELEQTGDRFSLAQVGNLEAIIPFIGGDFRGSMTIIIEEKLVACIGKLTLGDEYESEFAGELCNQCLGKIIAHFSEIDVTLSLDIGIPSVKPLREREASFFALTKLCIFSSLCMEISQMFC